MNESRRAFVRATGALAMGSGLTSRLGASLTSSLAGIAALSNQQARAATDYKALVCLFMQGGNDSANWIVPIDAGGYTDYKTTRGALALPASQLRATSNITSQGSGRQFAMPAELEPVRLLYEQGKAAVVANVGTLLQPMTKADFQAGRNLPPRLFSHNDQASTWQALAPEGAPSGWGGRMGDVFMSSNGLPALTAISVNGNAVFLAGNRVSQYQVTKAGPVQIHAANSGGWTMGSDSVNGALRRILADKGASAMQSDYSALVQRSMDVEASLRTALASGSAINIPSTIIGGESLSDNDLARQLQMIANLIAAGRTTLGMRRQVFLASIGGFDTHANQLSTHAVLTARVAQSIAYFNAAIEAMGYGNDVTLFTASDFGRTLTSNGSGSDHGWGAHHVVVGGAVKGRDIYGRMPLTALNTGDEVGSGRLIPGVSVSQYAATLGSWFGLSPTDLQTVLPGLSAFGPAPLAFV